MYLGIAMILLGAYNILSEYYNMDLLFKERVLVENSEIKWKEYFKVKIVLGVFSAAIGMLLIFNFFR
jgi:hypothetical protein